MTYDTVSYEVCITEILPGHGAIMGGKGPIQNRADFERYPWAELEARYWALAEPRFDALRRHLPPGMKALGGVGNGVLEISEDLVGFESLAYVQADDPALFADLYRRIGDLMTGIWQRFLRAVRRRLRHLPVRRRPGLQDQHARLPAHHPPAHHPAVPAHHRPDPRRGAAVPVALVRLHLQRDG